MIAIFGLGNPDKQYENTYHNAGYMVVDYFAKENGISFTKKKYFANVGEGMVAGEKVLLIKPTTYMNLSGKSVADVVRSLKLPLNKILVVYDDVDLEVGNLRFRKRGSAGTHNGMRNIIEVLGSQDFARLRVGINSEYNRNLIDYVLSKIKGENLEAIEKTLPIAEKVIGEFVQKKGDVDNIDINKYQK